MLEWGLSLKYAQQDIDIIFTTVSSSQQTFRKKSGVSIHQNFLNGHLYPGWRVLDERASVSQQLRWEEGKWARWKKPEGEWWSVR